MPMPMPTPTPMPMSMTNHTSTIRAFPTRSRLAVLVPFLGLLLLLCGGPADADSGCHPGEPKPTPASCPAGDDRPNVVFIMFDDLGYADLAPYGRDFLPAGETEHWISTPSIDELDANGIRFTQYYTAPTCSPTRVSLLSGGYQQRLNVRRQLPVFFETLRGVPDSVLSLPAMLQGAGYATGHFGKWHAGFARPEGRPLALGFDEACTLHEAGGLQYCDPLVRDGDEPTGAVVEGFTTETLFDYAESFLDRHATTGCPFFLQLWLYAPHTDFVFDACVEPCPEACTDDDDLTPCPAERSIQCYRDQYSGVPGLGGLGKHYAGLISKVDEQIGLLWQQLEHLGLADNTVFVVTDDNGGFADWAGAPTPTNGDLTGFKGKMFEGGIRAPFIVRWDDGIAPADRGADHIDQVMRFELYPTLAELAEVPAGGLAFDGASFAGVLADPDLDREQEILVFEHQPSKKRYVDPNGIRNDYAVRRGRFKLVYDHGPEPDYVPSKYLFDFTDELASPAQTYSEDPADDVSASYPQVVEALDEDLLDWRRRVGLLPFEVSHDVETAPGTLQRLGRDLRLTGSGGFARLGDLTLHDFYDGSFNLSVRVQPAAGSLGTERLVAGKSHSWELTILPGHQVRLEVWNEGDALESPSLVLTSTTKLVEGQWSWLAFDVYGWRNDQSTIRLLVDDEIVEEELPPGETQFAVTAVNPNSNRVLVGGDFGTSRNFRGVLRNAELHVSSLLPEELLRLRTGELLADDFENGTLGAWDTVTDPAPSGMSVTATAALFGELGLEIDVETGERRFLGSLAPVAADRHRSSFRVDLGAADLPGGAGQRLWVARSADVYPFDNVAMLAARDNAGVFEVRALARVAGGWAATAWLPLGGAVGSFEIEWRASDAAFGDGRLALRVLGGASEELRGLDTAGGSIERVDLGVVAAAAASGVYRFDHFESSRF